MELGTPLRKSCQPWVCRAMLVTALIPSATRSQGHVRRGRALLPATSYHSYHPSAWSSELPRLWGFQMLFLLPPRPPAPPRGLLYPAGGEI